MRNELIKIWSVHALRIIALFLRSFVHSAGILVIVCYLYSGSLHHLVVSISEYANNYALTAGSESLNEAPLFMILLVLTIMISYFSMLLKPERVFPPFIYKSLYEQE